MESLQKNNQFLKGRSEAFAVFRDMLAEEIVNAKPEAEAEVKEILEGRRAVEIPQTNGVAAGEGTSH